MPPVCSGLPWKAVLTEHTVIDLLPSVPGIVKEEHETDDGRAAVMTDPARKRQLEELTPGDIVRM